jgi:hypothetical protein
MPQRVRRDKRLALIERVKQVLATEERQFGTGRLETDGSGFEQPLARAVSLSRITE